MSADPAPSQPSLTSVDAVRQHQRRWLEEARASAERGEPFALCSSDEFEELFTLLGIPALVFNYWNFVIISQRKAADLIEALERRGYPGPHFFALGYGSTLEPQLAPWGGLPKPTIIVGSTRSESELKVTELWARELGCSYFPLDFNMSSAAKRRVPDDWWARLRTDWPQIVDPDRLDFRVAQTRALLAHVEALTGRVITPDALAEAMALLNTQVDIWMEATNLIASAPKCPVSLKDQIAIYQAMWSRGTQQAIDFIQAYRDEVAERVAAGVGAYPNERLRLLFWSMDQEPRSHVYMQERGAALVGSPYSSTQSFYARETYGDPMRALAARHLFLFDGTSPSWMLSEAARHRVDAVMLSGAWAKPQSRLRRALDAEGIPVLSLSHLGDDERVRDEIDAFLQKMGAA